MRRQVDFVTSVLRYASHNNEGIPVLTCIFVKQADITQCYCILLEVRQWMSRLFLRLGSVVNDEPSDTIPVQKCEGSEIDTLAEYNK